MSVTLALIRFQSVIAGMVEAGPDLVPLTGAVLEAPAELDGVRAEDR